ncbi:MAG TPA: hypothetical protein ENI91_02350 [Sphingomonadales bacterium]|nr:hypothetical protein [Sphingomonadales bacterium]
MKNIKIIFTERLKKTFIFLGLIAIFMNSPSDSAAAERATALLPLTSYNGLSITLSSFAGGRKIDMISDRIADRIADRAMRRAAKRAADKAEIRAEVKAEIKAETMAIRKITDRAAAIDMIRTKKTNRKARKTEKRALNRLQKFQNLYDDNGFKAIDHELLILAGKDALLNIDEKNYTITSRKYLTGLDMVLIKVSSPKNKKLSLSASEMKNRIDNADISLNHLFIPEFQDTDDRNAPYTITDISRNLNLTASNATDVHIGLIDTMVDTSHSALINQAITIEDFVPYDKERPKYHGTAIAAILVGHDPDKYKGIAIGAKLYAASVFFKYDKTKVAATTESLILALDWLVQQKTSVINMSLSGPPDPLLEIAINKVMEKGSIIVAAVGNGGPAAAPLYPAAYPGVVAVTAVDKQQHVYLQANRGHHVAFSAPGVNIPTANAGGGYRIRSGTSIAAPFVSAILAELTSGNDTVNIVKLLEKNTIDLGEKGFDNTYGYGLIQAVNTQVSTLQ